MGYLAFLSNILSSSFGVVAVRRNLGTAAKQNLSQKAGLSRPWFKARTGSIALGCLVPGPF